jgi:asparagine synthase (glutamine-hydrolysing)
LPPKIRKGKKKGFTPPLPFWIRHELREFLGEYFAPERLKATGMLNENNCRQLLDDHLQGRKDNNRQIWTILGLVCWLEKYGS